MTTATVREFQTDNRVEVESPYGTLTVCFIGDGCVYVESSNLVINGVDVYGSGHVYQWTDGSWHIGREFTDRVGFTGPETIPSSPYDRWSSGNLRRVDNFKEPSASARKKALAAFEEVAAAQFDTNPERFAEGQRRYVNNAIWRIEQQIEKDQAAVDALCDERDALHQAESNL